LGKAKLSRGRRHYVTSEIGVGGMALPVRQAGGKGSGFQAESKKRLKIIV